MREILFKGKQKDNGEWVEGFYIERKSDGAAYIATNTIGASINSIINNMTATAFRVIPETVGPFTCLYDSTKWEELTELEQKVWLKFHTENEWKGKKIFEGDILKNKLGYYVVVWDDKYLQWAVKNQKGVICFTLNTIISDKKRPCTAIGNIHDNPELLNKSMEQEG